MKKIIFSFLLIAAMGSSCKKDDSCGYQDVTGTAASSEVDYIRSYLTLNGITNAVEHSSGVFYVLNAQGTGNTVSSLCNKITVTYAGYQLGSTTPFDSYSDPGGVIFTLGQLILGIQKVMPVLKTGGTITMYIPPSMAYGNTAVENQNGVVILPANSYLKFEMALKAIQ